MKTALFRSLLVLLTAGALCNPADIVRAQAVEKSADVKIDPAPVTAKAGMITSFAPVVEKVAPSVVTISTSRNIRGARPGGGGAPFFNDPLFRRYFGLPEEEENPDEDTTPAPRRRGGRSGREGTQRQALGLGSGVIVSPEGHVLTNNHVVQDADDIVVQIGRNKREYKAKKVGTDLGTDLAVLKIDAKDLPAITFADSDKVRVGDLTIAIGNPFGLTQTVSMGIVSSLGRNDLGITAYENFIQTDASINPGNSGGALVDIEGRLVGINTAIFSRSGGNQGIGFAVPSNLAHSVMDSILKSGRVIRGYMGVRPQDLDETLKGKFAFTGSEGSLVAWVEPKSPAANAGIEPGDVITEVSGRKVEGATQLRMMVSGMAPGTKIDVKLVRGGKEKKVQVELAELENKQASTRPPEPDENSPDVLDGVTVADLDADNRKRFSIPDDAKGVVITQIDPDSPSAAAGLKVGDVVHEIEKQPVNSAKDAVEMSEKLKKEKQVLLRFSRRGVSNFVVVKDNE